MAISRRPLGDQGLNELANNNQRTAEYLIELQGREGSRRYRMMSRGDASVGMIIKAHKNPLRSCNWHVPLPDDATPQEIEIVDTINDWMFSAIEGSLFLTLLDQSLSCIEYGFSVFERYYEPGTYDNKTYLYPILEQRLQTSIEDILPKEKIIRQSTIDKGMIDIPFDNLVFFILNQQGEDMRGEAVIRNAYPSYKKKKIYEEWMGMGIQRSAAGGIPSMIVPRGTKTDSADYIAAESLLQNITTHENAYMILQEGWTFTIQESKFNAEQVQKAIDSQNSEMAMSVLVQFILLGQQGNSGAYALSRDQSDFFLDGLTYIVGLIERGFNCGMIHPFIKLNFGDSVDCSRIGLRGLNLNKKAGQELANVLSELKGGGFIIPTVDDEIQLRKSLDMPELSEEEIDKRNLKDQMDMNSLTDNTNSNSGGSGGSGGGDNVDPNMSPEEKQAMIDKQASDKAAKARGNKLKIRNVKLSEPKVKARLENVDKNIKETTDFMKANLMLIKDKLLADIESTLNRGTVEISGLKAIEISSTKYLKSLEKKISSIAIDAWNAAKADAKNNIKFAEGQEPKDIVNAVLRQFVLNQVDSVVDNQASSILSRAILTASNGSLKGFTIPQTVSNVDKAIEDYINSNSVDVAGSLIVVGTTNFGESQFFKEISDQLWGYEFLNADPVSQICQWYNGKTFSVNSPELSMATPPLHPNCKSYMSPIYKTQDKPSIDDVIAPPSIQGQKSIF